MTWRCLIADVTTGQVVNELQPAAAPDWSTEIGDKGSWGVSLDLGKAPNIKDDVLGYMTTGRYAWVVGYKDYLLQGGIPSSGGFDQKSRTLSVSGSGIGGLFDNRIVRAANGTPATIVASGNNVTLTSLTRRRVMRELMAVSLADSDSGANLPFDITDAAAETGSEGRSFISADLATVWRRLVDETEAATGPEFIIRPYFTGTSTIGWKLALGTPLLGNQALNALWELGSAVGNIDVDYNMAVPIPHRVWVKGGGDTTVAVMGYAQNTTALQAAHIPYADYVDTSHTDISDKAKLDEFAAVKLAELSVLTETWSASVRIDGKNRDGKQISPELGSWIEGDAPQFRVIGHPVIPDGTYRKRITGMSPGSEPGTVALKIKPTPLA